MAKKLFYYLVNKLDVKGLILIFMVAVYPLIVIPGMLDSFRGPKFIFMAVTSLFALFYLVRDRISFRHHVFIPLGIFLLLAVLSTLLAEDPQMAWMGSSLRYTGLSTYLSCVILFLLASRYENPKLVLMPMIICAMVASMIGLMQFYGYNFIPHRSFYFEDIHVYSTMGNMNWFGTYIVFILPASLLFYLKEKKIIWLVTTVLIYGGLLVSMTRGVWLSFFVSFLVIFIVLFKNKEIKKHFAILFTALALTSLTLLPANDWILYDRISTVFEATTSYVAPEGVVDDSVQIVKASEQPAEDPATTLDYSERTSGSIFERLYLWDNTIDIIKENWATGIGADHLRIQVPGGRIVDKAHNIYLEIAVTMGVFALGAYLIFISFILRRQNNKIGFIFFMMILTYFLQGFFNNDIVQVMPLLWIVLGLSLANNSYFAQLKADNVKNTENKTFNVSTRSRGKSTLHKYAMLVLIVTFLLIMFWFFYPKNKTVEIPGQGVYTGQLRGFSTFHGFGTWESEQGYVYEGDFRHGQYDGFGTLTFANGAKYIGEFKQGYFHGQGKIITAAGEVIEGEWKKGRLLE